MKYYQLFLIACLLIAGCQTKMRFSSLKADPTPVVTTPATPLQCPTGGTVVTIGLTDIVICNGLTGNDGSDGTDGQDGSDGSDGSDGAPGADGSSCSAQSVTNGALITCTNGTSAFVSNGVDGANGVNGINGLTGATGPQGLPGTNGNTGPAGPPGVSPAPGAFDIVAIVEPCAATNSEVLLRLRDNRLLAHYSSGAAQYLALIGPGNYILTDGGPACHFTVGPAPTYTITQ